MTGPLAGLRVLEFEGIGPAPYAGMLLADLGADVVRIARPAADRGPLIADTGGAVLDRGKTTVPLDLKDPAGLAAARALAAAAEGLIEGLRPGVMERLGLGPAELRAANPRLVYVRVTGWGQAGPLARTAGHDINYIALSGALAALGPPDRPPPPPLNLVGDFGGGGLLAAFGMVSGLLSAARTGQGTTVDAAMVDGAASQMAMIYAWTAAGLWSTRRGSNLLDGAAPFYRCYACADGRHVAVGAIEPAFFAALMAGLGLDAHPADQTDRAHWPDLADRIAAAFAAHPRAHWERVFEGSDACVTPVLDVTEAPVHPHARARSAFADGPAPAPVPRFEGTATRPRPAATATAADILARWQAASAG